MRPKSNLSLRNIPIEFHSHYIRGYFDGDGSIYFFTPKRYLTEQVYMEFCSSNKSFLQEIKNILNMNCNSGGWIEDRDTYSRLTYSGRLQIKRIGKFLYDNSTIYLGRKKERFDRIP